MEQERQKALLIGANVDFEKDFNEKMDELEKLANACEIDVV